MGHSAAGTARIRRALWLVHGVWTELPPGNDFDDVQWKEDFRREMRRVADVVHGAAEIPARPGHAGGRYDTDVSRWTLGYIIGREWEPYAVKAHDGRAAAPASYHGRYLGLARGTPIDAWMAAECDYLLGYEVATYNALRLIAYTNWPTLESAQPYDRIHRGIAQSEWHLDARVGRRWGTGNRLDVFGTVTNSAVSSTSGAFRYRTAGVSVRLGL